MNLYKLFTYSITSILLCHFVSFGNNPAEGTGRASGSTVSQSPETTDTPFPFNQPDIVSLLNSPKKVFAHYFTPFPISLDNKDPDYDFYETGYLSPTGESNKHLSYGGYLRERPLPRSPRIESNWKQIDMEEEIRRAVALGIDGFACDLLSGQGYVYYDRVVMLMEAAEKVAPGFKILLMPDMEAFKNATDKVAEVVKALSQYSAAYRLGDGRLVVSPFNSQVKDAGWWKSWLEQMKADGVDIAFFPLFQSWQTYAPSFAPISYGMSAWGNRSVNVQVYYENAAATAHNTYNSLWMMPVSPQDFRPKSKGYYEAQNSLNFRTMWKNAINGGSDWVQLITWNDYSEHTEIAPSSGTQHAFYDLTAYYVTWFKTGIQPKITRDVLYYFYRKHHTGLTPKLQTSIIEPSLGSDTPADSIELLSFLTEPGMLEIEIAGHKYQKPATSGINSFKIASVPGKPVFRLYRKNKLVSSVAGAIEIVPEIDYQDFLYYGGSSSRAEVDDCLSAPVANFTSDINSVEAGNPVSFIDLSSGCGSTWSWTFGGGTPSSSIAQNPVVYYNTPGYYDVLLFSINKYGSSSKKGHIMVVESGTQIPYGGTIRTLPGLIETEEYDTGGEGVSYHDDQSKSGDLSYRPADNVDVVSRFGASNGYSVGATAVGEWLEYTVDDVTGGIYDIILTYSCQNDTTNSVKVSLAGNVLGTFPAIPNTGGKDVFSRDTLRNITITGGMSMVLRLDIENGGGFDLDAIQFNLLPSGVSIGDCPSENLDINQYYQFKKMFIPANATYDDVVWSSSDPDVVKIDDNGLTQAVENGTATITVTTGTGSYSDSCPVQVRANMPYSGSPGVVPWKIEGEEYDQGGQGTSFSDDNIKEGDATYRPEDNVDVYSKQGASNGYSVSSTEDGEWLEYTVDIVPGMYDIILSYSSNSDAPGELDVSLSGNLVGIFSGLPNTGGEKQFSKDTISNVYIYGRQEMILRLTLSNGAGFDIDALTFNLKPTSVSIVNGHSVTMRIGETINLEELVSPDNASYREVSWSSSDTSVVTVNSTGLVTALKEGLTTITVTTNAEGKTDDCEIEVIIKKPYGGVPANIPGKIEGEEYDQGGQGLSYNDDNSKQGSTDYRPKDMVDVVQKSGASNGYSIGWTLEGEWLEYTVNAVEGTYDIIFLYASGTTNHGDLLVELDGQQLAVFSGLESLGWITFTSDTIYEVPISGGNNRILRLTYINGADFDIDAIIFKTSKTTSAETTVSMPGTRLEVAPNPIKQKANISFKIPTAGFYRLDIYDVNGTQIERISEGDVIANKNYIYEFTPDSKYKPGVYFIRLSADGMAHNVKVVIL